LKKKSQNNNLDFTGERVVPGKVDITLLEEHVSRYLFALEFAKGANVLDAACGTGYGCFIMASAAKKVTGIDISSESTEFAKKNYSLSNIEYMTGDIISMPFPECSFDLIIAYEIFEHLKNPEKMLTELYRVAAHNGKIIISTPNADFLKSSVPNPFHVKEYRFQEFREIIENNIKGMIRFHGQRKRRKGIAIQKHYLRIKRMLGIGPILKKAKSDVLSPHELLSMSLMYEFAEDKINQSEFLIAVMQKS